MSEFSWNLENMGRKRRMQALANLEALHGLKAVVRVDMAPEPVEPIDYLAHTVEIDYRSTDA